MKIICTMLLLVITLSTLSLPLSYLEHAPKKVQSHVVTEAEVMPPHPTFITPTPAPTHRASRHRKTIVEHQHTRPATSRLTSGGVWARLRYCESGSDGLYKANTGNGFYGAYQFNVETLEGLGYTLSEYMASPAVQDAAARKLQSQRGWQPWPACRRKLGLP